jgi:N-acetyl-anhydromuramyl-L-alanine amidase AmpD
MRPLKGEADPKYRAVHDSGARFASDIKYVVVHCTEGDTAEGAASWFTNPASGGSTNMVVDDNIAYRTVPDLVVPWGAPPLNKAGWHIEFAGYSSWTTAEWMQHKFMLQRGAFKCALRCKRYNIPVRWVGPVGLKLGRRGIVTHKAIADTWHQTTHTDPGKGFPRKYFLELVKKYMNEI